MCWLDVSAACHDHHIGVKQTIQCFNGFARDPRVIYGFSIGSNRKKQNCFISSFFLFFFFQTGWVHYLMAIFIFIIM
ncbi:hypothetical protein HanHA300_Chr11g0396021 [Helianthus annuus]|nr:hypothetical protein HanHA300_Chr11g0396021 [Helianthus annuus]KAJ0516912.1 hypothetical protein HanHA89_Chr11g0419251 [Helianthus annuus]KAJ0684922.1 hypothetical protein HanLR1_Chr11g0396681 [Helianthus annuus]KAJ0688847.1 hypothetical protein HanOQP8_Chr11g0398881 [Helianthus annuus]